MMCCLLEIAEEVGKEECELTQIVKIFLSG